MLMNPFKSCSFSRWMRRSAICVVSSQLGTAHATYVSTAERVLDVLNLI